MKPCPSPCLRPRYLARHRFSCSLTDGGFKGSWRRICPGRESNPDYSCLPKHGKCQHANAKQFKVFSSLRDTRVCCQLGHFSSLCGQSCQEFAKNSPEVSRVTVTLVREAAVLLGGGDWQLVSSPPATDRKPRGTSSMWRGVHALGRVANHTSSRPR